jgi:hypothetical protein
MFYYLLSLIVKKIIIIIIFLRLYFVDNPNVPVQMPDEIQVAMTAKNSFKLQETQNPITSITSSDKYLFIVSYIVDFF